MKIPTFKDMLLANPRGWLDQPPTSLYRGEIRSSNEPAADYYGEQFGPMAGVMAQHLMNAGDVGKEIALGLTGVTGAEAGGAALARGVEEGDATRMAGGVGQIGLAALPFSGKVAGKVIETVPRMAAFLTGATLAPQAADGMFSPAMADESSPLQQLYAQRSSLLERQQAAVNEANMQARTGKGPKWEAANAEVQRLTSELAGVDGMIGDLNKKNSPEEALRIKELERQQAENAKKEEMDKPFQERHPNASLAMTLGAPLLSGVLAYKGMQGVANKGKSLMGELLDARKAGDVIGVQEAAAALKHWKNTAPIKQAAAVAVPATLPIEARAIGDNIDKFSLPPSSKAQQEATRRLSDPMHYIMDSIPALVSGGVLAATGGKAGSMRSPAPRGEASALSKMYAGKDSSKLADFLRSGARESAALQDDVALHQTAASRRQAINPAAGAGNPIQPPQPSSGPAGQGSQNPLPRGPSRDSFWDSKTSRWRGRDGKFRPGEGPAND